MHNALTAAPAEPARPLVVGIASDASALGYAPKTDEV